MSPLKTSLKRFVSTTMPTTFKSLVYSSHDVQDCTKVLSLHNYHPSEKSLGSSIVLRALAFPINPSDINQLEGVYPSKPAKTLDLGTEKPSAIAGNEGAFEVVHVQEEVQGLSIGDIVIPLQANFGTWSTYRTCQDASELVKVNGCDRFAASSIAVNGCTAYQLLNNYVDWDPNGNDWLVQNAGTSSVSKIVTQLAKMQNVKTLSVIRDRDNFEEVAKELETKYGATKVISESQNNDKEFCQKTLPSILGPDAHLKLALNSVGGKSSSSIARKLDYNATMLTYGGMSKMPVSLPPSLYIFKGLKSLGFWVTKNSLDNPDEKRETVQKVAQLYAEGKLISPKDEVRQLEWDVKGMSDDEVLDLIKTGITQKGKKNVVTLKW
ncbi:LANO_0A04698g1_1 [Lachancea nothofagi CBS 11611]|uniref:LANO_0A04698g1_1 n=1 Tax=Lachancea nothofagi CBS 11611 TaxID=1266666 RepID=A0A1G4IQV2_9SACH|nr:LANO_0A04698g1_1 [Lachancea nothofagi CBS 11611]